MAAKPLSEKQVQAFVAAVKSGVRRPLSKLGDGGGMFLTVTTGGKPVWRLKYRLGGKEQLYTLGAYPGLRLAAARQERDRLRQQILDKPINLTAVREDKVRLSVENSENTFRNVAERWLEGKKGQWKPIHYRKSRRALERDVYPILGDRPIADIRPPEIKRMADTILKRKVYDTAGQVLQHVDNIFQLAQALGFQTGGNPVGPVKSTMPRKPKPGRMAAALDFGALGKIMSTAQNAADTTRLSQVVHLAHRLCAFTAARIGNVVEAQWKEFNLEAAPFTWTIPRAKMKARDRHHDHKIILSQPIAQELLAWRKAWNVQAGSEAYVFTSQAKFGSTRPISRESVEKAYRELLALKDQHSPHGWRAAFSTLARENGFERDVVELALDHVHDNEVVRAYDRGERLKERIRLMNWWGAQLVAAQSSSAS
ncbi:MAG TPA: integrase arm-type DNA-binding domain-containing protein [bacterium]|jgi:integrase|nr:integrase arm-type DNA-binding domain-containing protein [bacterium]